MWKPKEIIIHESVKDDPATLYFLKHCQGVPVRHIDNGDPKNVASVSKILINVKKIENLKNKILAYNIAGKQVVYISPATKAVEPFEMADDRMLCPHFEKVKFASNGCFYQCDWCYLKLTYRCAYPYMTVKVQYDEIKKQLEKKIADSTDTIMFNSGEMADSLSMEHLTGVGKEFIPWFGKSDKGRLFMLTKSDNVDGILDLEHNGHTTIAWSINNDKVSRKFELGAPTTECRLNAAKKVQDANYPLRIRLDPIVPINDWKKIYSETVKQIFDKVSPESITLGTLRFEKGFYTQRKTIFSTGKKLTSYVENMIPMFKPKTYFNKKGKEKRHAGKYSFNDKKRIEIFNHVIKDIKKYSDCKIALCKESINIWKQTGLDASQCSCACQFEPVDMTPQIKVIPGQGLPNILLIAPHGVETVPYDDENTAELTERIARELGCSAIINEIYRKPEDTKKGKRNGGNPDLEKMYLNLNSFDQAKLHPDFITDIENIVKDKNQTTVIWIHGADDDNLVEEAKKFESFKQRPEQLRALIGYGQGPDRSVKERKRTEAEREDRTTIKKELAEKFAQLLTDNGIISELTSSSATNFCGRASDNMNQWFLGRYSKKEVQSIQVEFGFSGIRKKETLEASAKNISYAIASLLNINLPEVVKDDPKIEEAYNHIKGIFVKHFQNAMLEVGHYLVLKMYGNYTSAIARETKGRESLSKLAKRIQQDSQEKGNAPSRTWIYDAVNLAIDNNRYKEKILPSVYGQLGHSHKVNLTYAPELKIKKLLTEETVEKQYTVSKLRERIREEKNKSDPNHVFPEELNTEISLVQFKKFTDQKLKLFRKETKNRVEQTNKKLNLYQKNLERLEEFLQYKLENSSKEDTRIQVDF